MIQKNKETRTNILKGAEILYDAVSSTMGPKGRNVIIKDKLGRFSVTHDGVTVAKAVKHDDPAIQLGIDLIKEASKEMDKVGDGTTTVTVLTYHLIKGLYELINGKWYRKGMNPMMIKRELDYLVDGLIDYVEYNSTKIGKNYNDVFDVANISVADETLAAMVAKLVVGTGYEGTINVQTQAINETTAELVEGYLLPNGYASEHFITNQSSRECVIENPTIIIVNGKMDSMQTYDEFLGDLVASNKRDLVFICESIDSDLLTSLVYNKIKGQIRAVVIKNTFGVEYATDIASVVGAEVYEKFTALPTVDIVGSAKRVVVTDGETIIFGGAGDSSARLKDLTSQNKKKPTNELKQRISALSGKVGSIKVGGVTETEADEKKYRIDDAVAATRAAIKGGIVPGAGRTLYNASKSIMGKNTTKVVKAVREALRKPGEILLSNSGYSTKILSKMGPDEGIDVSTGYRVMLIPNGIVDPTIVTTEVIRNAFAVAGLAITIGGSIVDKPMTQEEIKAMLDARL